MTEHTLTKTEGTTREHYRLQTSKDLDPLMERIGDARFVLLGEASHGTHEFYSWRMAISKRLIQEKGFSFIAVEGDWPDCYVINRFVKGYQLSDKKAVDVLMSFRRWPTWMWGNWEVASLIEWMREYNKSSSSGRKAGFYGLDVYSLWESMEGEVMSVPPAIKGSMEELLHMETADNRIIFSHSAFKRRLPHRAIGVVYRPAAERANYVSSLLASRYDALLYFDRSQAFHPLHLQPHDKGVPETYPFGI